MNADGREVFAVVLFHDRRLLLIGEHAGPLATQEDYEHGRCSFAELMPSGDILRFGEVIGHREDLQFTGEVVVPTLAEDAFGNLTDPIAGGWRRPL